VKKIKANDTGGPVTRMKIGDEESFGQGGYPKAQPATIYNPPAPNSPPTEGLVEGPLVNENPLYQGKPTKRRTVDLKESDASFRDRVSAGYVIHALGEPAVVTETESPTKPVINKPAKAPQRPQPERLDTFNKAIAELKKDFTGLRQLLPEPPTYVWKLTETATQEDVKDMLKINFPKLMWTFRADGIPVAYVQFAKGGNMELALGYRSNTLTVTHDADGDQYF